MIGKVLPQVRMGVGGQHCSVAGYVHPFFITSHIGDSFFGISAGPHPAAEATKGVYQTM